MKQMLSILSLLLIALLAGCADTESHPAKKKHAMVGTNDSQFTTNAPTTSAVPPTDTNSPVVTDTNSPETNSVASSPANPFATPTPVPVAAPRDLPYGTPVPGKPGFVTSPHSPTAGYVDVRGFPPGSEVKDPYSGKIFLVP
jgi:ABC-type Fe3+-hydroxamate transport system substrate-binding protein